MTRRCKHAHRPSEAYEISVATGREKPTIGPMLCGWWHAVKEHYPMIPPWLGRNASGGHLLRYPEDCEACPCFEKAPIEDPAN